MGEKEREERERERERERRERGERVSGNDRASERGVVIVRMSLRS